MGYPSEAAGQSIILRALTISLLRRLRGNTEPCLIVPVKMVICLWLARCRISQRETAFNEVKQHMVSLSGEQFAEYQVTKTNNES